ncbi:Permease of the drug/metabolite transporter (DMT) superfamily [plant metagenome]|uniref:Permease of the drug/metabolite transporter (DMT) superfamily n=1 Tax=plant metagenome TaxID=1297885 RepID=A0A484V2A9_9ZZZZ
MEVFEAAMKYWIKRILIGLVVLALVVVVGVAIFLLTFDPNAYKYKLEEMIQARYDRSLSIEGPIELSLFPRIGLSVQDVSLSEAGSTEQFASIESARVAVAVWPLLFNQLVVDHVTINGFKARVVRGKDGEFNFSNLVNRGDGALVLPERDAEPETPAPAAATDTSNLTPAQAAAGATALGAEAGAAAVNEVSQAIRRTEMQIDIAGLDLKEGDIQLQDAQSGMAVRIANLNVATGRVTFDQAFDVSLSARIEGGNPRVDAGLTAQGLLKLDPAAMKYGVQRLDMRMDGRLGDVTANALTARGNLAFDAGLSALDVSGLEVVFAGDMKPADKAAKPLTGVEATMTVPRLSAHPGRLHLQIEKLVTRATGRWGENPFEFAVDAPALNIQSTKASGQALTGRLRVDGEEAMNVGLGLTGLSGTAQALDIKEAKLDVNVKQGQRLIQGNVVSPLSLSLLQRMFALSALKGEVRITDPGLPNGALQIPVIGSLSADLSKDQARARLNAVLEGGKFDLSADVTRLADPLVKFGLAVDTLDLDKLAPARLPVKPQPATGGRDGSGTPPPAPAPAPQPKPVDFSVLNGVTADGSIKVGELVVRNLKASDFGAKIKIAQGKLDISEIAAQLYEGKLAGQLSADANGNQLGAKLSLSDIAIDPILTDVRGQSHLSGKGGLTLDLRASGVNSDEWRRTLGGTAQLRLRDGAIKGINIAALLREARAAASGSRDEGDISGPRQTDFSSLEADLALAKGIATVRRLEMAAPLLRVSQGKPAELNLVDSLVNLVLNVRVVNTSTGQDGKALAALRNVTIPLQIAGPMDKPVYSLQWRGAGSEALRRSLEDKLAEEIERHTSKLPVKPTEPQGTGEGGLVEQETVKSLGNALKGLLGR